MTTLINVRTTAQNLPTTLDLVDGRIARIGGPVPASDTLDCQGMLVLPALVEPHLHLDKALLEDVLPNPTGTLAGAISVTAQLKASFTRLDLHHRARQVLDRAVLNGTTLARVHTDVDPVVGTLSVEVMLELREAYTGIIDLQVVAFPQEGLLSRPGTEQLLRRCLEMGTDVIGGCTYSENTVRGCEDHVRTVLDLAQEFDVPADFHADFADDSSEPRFRLAPFIASQTSERAMAGRVTTSHMTALAAAGLGERAEIINQLAEAGVSVVALPATDLHLGGRTDVAGVRRAVSPVKELRAGGVLTAASSNNVRNAFTPSGNADQFETALLLAQVCHMSTASDLIAALDMVSAEAAHVVGTGADHGVQLGAKADLIVVDAATPTQALMDRSPRRYVLKAGRVVAESVLTQRLHYSPQAPDLSPRVMSES